MTKKNKNLVKRSKSVNDLSTSSPWVDQQVQQLQEKLTNLQKSLGNQDPTLLRKARQELITIRQRLQELFPDQTTAKPSELLEQLIIQRHELTDHNNELRINNLKQKDYFTKYQQESKITQQLKLQVAQLKKDFTITQQDLKSAQGIIELRTLNLDNEKNQENYFNHWTWIRFSLLTFLTYLLLNNLSKPENNHGKPRN